MPLCIFSISERKKSSVTAKRAEIICVMRRNEVISETERRRILNYKTTADNTHIKRCGKTSSSRAFHVITRRYDKYTKNKVPSKCKKRESKPLKCKNTGSFAFLLSLLGNNSVRTLTTCRLFPHTKYMPTYEDTKIIITHSIKHVRVFFFLHTAALLCTS